MIASKRPGFLAALRRLAAAGLALLATGLLPGGGRAQPAVQAQPPARYNIILILSDDHRYDFMGFHPGAPGFLETPNLDRMAAGGAHLRNAFVSTSLCSPSRASILTGQYVHHHGIVDNNRLVQPGTVFFPQYLQEAGYDTAFIGKWHMGDEKDDPRPGFDHWISYKGQGTYYDPTFNIDGQHVQRDGYTADLVTDYALEWLGQDRSKPFFLYLSHKSVHAMFGPAERHEGRYDNVPIEYPETMADTEENYRDKPWWVRAQRFSSHGVDYAYQGDLDFDTFYRRYAETLLGLDENIGRVLDYLEGAGLAHNTIVLYMSDNGFSLGEHGLIDKRHMYEESMRIPMIVYAPGLVAPGTAIDAMVQNIDVAPTLLALAGLPVPDDMDGQSFLPLLRGEAGPWREAVLYEYYWEWSFPYTPTMIGLRTDQYKYIFYHGIWDTDEFYDLEQDPAEKYNLINSVAHQELIAEMRTRLANKLETTGGLVIPLHMPEGAPAVHPRPPTVVDQLRTLKWRIFGGLSWQVLAAVLLLASGVLAALGVAGYVFLRRQHKQASAVARL